MTRQDLMHRLELSLQDTRGNRYAAIQAVLDSLKGDPREAVEALELLGPTALAALLPPENKGLLPQRIQNDVQPPRAEWTVAMLKAHMGWIRALHHGIGRRLQLCQSMVKLARSDDELLGRDIVPRLPLAERGAVERMLGIRTLAA